MKNLVLKLEEETSSTNNYIDCSTLIAENVNDLQAPVMKVRKQSEKMEVQ